MVYIKSVILRGSSPLSFYTDLQSYRSAVVQICSLLYFCLFRVKYILLLCVAGTI